MRKNLTIIVSLAPIATAILLKMTVNTTPLGNTALTTFLEMAATTTPLGNHALTISLEMPAATTPSGSIAPITHSETGVNTLNSHQIILILLLNISIINITTSEMDVSVFYL